MKLKEYQALPKGTKVKITHKSGKVEYGIIVKVREVGRNFSGQYNAISIGGHAPSNIALQFISLVEENA